MTTDIEQFKQDFWAQVDIIAEGQNANNEAPGPCWPWLGSLSRQGYGIARVRKKQTSAHRVAFAISGGKLSKEKPFVLHKCDNKRCCNPSHLYAGNNSDNQFDRSRRNHSSFQIGSEHPGAKLTEDDVREIMDLWRRRVMTLKSLSARYGTRREHIWRIVSGRSWIHVTGGRVERLPRSECPDRWRRENVDPTPYHVEQGARLNVEMVMTIIKLRIRGRTARRIAVLLNDASLKGAVEDVISGETWKHITGGRVRQNDYKLAERLGVVF